MITKLEELCVRVCDSAALEGCQSCKLDFLKNHSYLRSSAGIDKARTLDLHFIFSETKSQQTSPSKFHHNVVDKQMERQCLQNGLVI